MPMVRWYRKAGVELTRYEPWAESGFISPKEERRLQKKYGDLSPRVLAYQRDDLRQAKITKIKSERAKAFGNLPKGVERLIGEGNHDPCCFEVSSRPMKRWSSLKTFYTAVDKLLVSVGYLRYSDEVCGAGGHIHVGVTAKEAVKVQQFMLNHPWAFMAFEHPSNDQTSLRNVRRTYVATDELYCSRETSTSKQYAVSYRCYGTVEFRMFDVARSWEEQEEHMAFAQAFVEYAVQHPTPKKFMTRETVDKLSVEKCKAGFENLIKDLGLPWDRYESYLQYIEARFKFKTSNFG